MFMRINFLLVCLVLTSCSKPLVTPFTYANSYQEVKLADDLYELHIQGSYNIAPGTVRQFFLCRAAELTLQNGGKYFVILRDKREREKGVPTTQQILQNTDALINGQDKSYLYTFLNHHEVEKQLKYSNTGIIKICAEMPLDAPFYDAGLISTKMLPGAKKVKRYDEHRPVFWQLMKQAIDLTDVI